MAFVLPQQVAHLVHLIWTSDIRSGNTVKYRQLRIDRDFQVAVVLLLHLTKVLEKGNGISPSEVVRHGVTEDLGKGALIV